MASADFPPDDDADSRSHHTPQASNARLIRIFVVITSALLIQSLDATIVATALDALQTEFGTSLGRASATITAYATGLVIALPVGARLCEVFDPKFIFLASVTAFATFSLLCGLTVSMEQLIVFRGAQAIAAAGATPAMTMIVVDHFGRARDRAFGFFASVFQLGSIAGPVIGGLFVEYLSWRWIFEINVPVCLLIVGFGIKVIPRSPRHGGAARPKINLDGLGVLLLGATVIAMMVGAGWMSGDSHSGHVIGIAVMAASLMLGVCFVAYLRRASSPLIAPMLLLGQNFRRVNLINIVYGGGIVGALSLLPVHAMQSFGLDALRAGSLLSIAAVAGTAFAVVGTIGLRRFGYRSPIALSAVAVGLVLVAVGVNLFPGASPYLVLGVAAGIIGMTTGLADPAVRNSGLQLLPSSAPAIAAVRTMCRQVGTVVVVSALSLVGTQFAATSGLRWGFIVFGVVLLLAIPVIRGIPDHRGAW